MVALHDANEASTRPHMRWLGAGRRELHIVHVEGRGNGRDEY